MDLIFKKYGLSDTHLLNIISSSIFLGESCTPKNEVIYHFVSQCLDPPM